MIAYYTWTNTQIINAANCRINIFKDGGADLYVLMTEKQISEPLLEAIKDSGIFDNVYCLDLLLLNYKKLLFGFIPNFRILFLQSAYKKAYSAMLEHTCGEKKYDRVVLPWFHAGSVFLIHHWVKTSRDLKISFLDEGTGSYCLYKKDFIHFPVPFRTFKEYVKNFIVEAGLCRKYARRVDSICLYRPEYCREGIDYLKYRLPLVDQISNPVMYQILCNSVSQLEYAHFLRYDKRDVYYFSTYNLPEGKSFDDRSMKIIKSVILAAGERDVLVKVHTNSVAHARNFARSLEKVIFVDREKYIFEGLYLQIPNRENKVLVSVASTTALYSKFMFNEEPYVIFVYRLYDTYRQLGVERDDWVAEILLDAYSDKSRVMIPNSMYELKSMLASVLNRDFYGIDEEFLEGESQAEGAIYGSSSPEGEEQTND